MAKNTGAKTKEVTVAGTDTGTEAGSGQKTGTRTRDPETTLYFNGERDAVLASLVLAHNGQLTSAAIVRQLAQHPAFADQQVLLLSGEKNESVRQRVIKLSKRAKAMGLGELSLKRQANTGYDADDVLRQVFASQRGVQVPATAPAQGSGNPVAGGFTGGLIPTA